MPKFTEIATTTERHPNAPPAWWVLNAPRPLYGTIHVSGNDAFTWTGPFVEGIHYAAIDPTDPEASRWLEENRRLGAVLLRYVTEDEIAEWAGGYCHPVPVEEFTEADLRQAFFALCGRREVEIG